MNGEDVHLQNISFQRQIVPSQLAVEHQPLLCSLPFMRVHFHFIKSSYKTPVHVLHKIATNKKHLNQKEKLPYSSVQLIFMSIFKFNKKKALLCHWRTLYITLFTWYNLNDVKPSECLLSESFACSSVKCVNCIAWNTNLLKE